MNEFTNILLMVGSSIATGFAGWVFGRRKNKADAQSVELDNTQKAIEIWREAAENLNEQMKIYNNEIIKLRDDNTQMKEEISRLRKQIIGIEDDNNRLRKEVNKLKNCKEK